ncbi:MAG: transketolase [Nitrospirae bacterium]|nr:transketolase [Nitrospirota bacterium]
MRNAFIDTAIAACAHRDDVFIIAGDAGLGVFDNFKETHPDRFINLGVAEQNMASMASGLAMAGYKVFIYNIIPFVLYRCYEQIRNDICYQDVPVVLVGIGSGLTYAPQGMTHYSIEDIGLARTLPNLTVISPIDPMEAMAAARYALNARHPVYVRLAKRGEPNIHSIEPPDITMPQVVRDGSDVAIFFHGSIAEEAIKAAAELAEDNIHPRLVSMPMIQPINEQGVADVLKGIKTAITVEEHYANCGFGDIFIKTLIKHPKVTQIETLGIPPRFIHEIKDTKGMRDFFGISSPFIVKTVKKYYNR